MWTNYDDEEIRKNLQTLYNKLPDSKKSSKLRGFINSPFGTDAFKTYSSKLQNVYEEFKLNKTGKVLLEGIAVGKKIALMKTTQPISTRLNLR